MKFDENYPRLPPKCTFDLPFFHPNVHLSGRICVSTLSNDWCPAFSFKNILLSIQTLLDEPNPNNPAHLEAAKCYRYVLISIQINTTINMQFSSISLKKIFFYEKNFTRNNPTAYTNRVKDLANQNRETQLLWLRLRKIVIFLARFLGKYFLILVYFNLLKGWNSM